MVTRLNWVTCEGKDVADTQSIRTHQVSLQGKTVAIAARHLANWLNSMLQQNN
jgi:hypothetical protein